MIRTPLSVRVYNFLLSNGVACLREVYEDLDEKPCRVDDCLRRLWMKGFVLRTREPTFEFETCHRGRAGCVGYNRAINYYVANNGQEIGSQFVGYEDRKKDGRSREIESKATKILNFLKKNNNEAFYSVDIVKALDIKSRDVMPNIRRYEKKGLVFVRGYQSHDQRSPFKKGFILTWIDQDLPRDQAIKEAFERTNKVLLENPTSNTIHESVRLIRDQLLASNDLLSMAYLRNIMQCDIDQAERYEEQDNSIRILNR